MAALVREYGEREGRVGVHGMSQGSRSVAIPQAVQIAFELLEAGNLQKAQTILLQILEVEPDHPDALHLLGIIGLQAGDFERAREAIAKAVDLEPSNPYFLNSLGNACLKLNRDVDAESCFRRSVALAPEYFEAHNNLATALKRLGGLEEAERSCRGALALQPDYAEAHNNLANTLFEMGRLEEAEQCCDRAVALKPDFAEAHNNRGNVLWKLGRPDEAEPCYRKALVLRPDYAEAHSNLGNALFDMGRLEQAEQCYRRAFALKPDYARPYCNLANTLLKMERVEEAEQNYRRAIALQPGYSEAHGGLAVALRTLGRLEEAERSWRRALELKPDHAEAHSSLGSTLFEMGRFGDAERSYLQALALQPDHAEAHYNLGLALSHTGRLEDAERHYRRALELKPAFPEAHDNLGSVLSHIGRLEEALTCYRGALALKPDYAEAHSNLIFVLDLLEHCDTPEQQEERRRWYVQHGRVFGHSASPHDNSPDPARKLRIGYVSADFRRHSAYYIFAPIIRLQHRSAFEVICYSGVKNEDDATLVIRESAHWWRSTSGISDESLAEQIRSDRIDILVDLSGHSAGNRLLVFARKPAPVQITAWGHATGTGLETMDYFFADPVLVPESERQYFSEEVIDLPCCICYEPPEYAPAVSPLPSLAGTPLTFGCLNRIEKISGRILGLWAQILGAVPNSRILIKDSRIEDSGTREQLLRRLAGHGIGRERVCLLGPSPHIEHLKIYGEVDLALDPFPHGGGVSSMEALWMGVPVVTLVGSTTPSRLTASILTALGKQDWIARSDDEYVGKALDMAGDLPRLAHIRKELRTCMAGSILGDVPAYTRAVESSYRTLWRRWCERPRP
ncbi:MAG: hypothetical protein A3I00_04715 [Betaproteobacteria bacterium RIFCSPLOWO2_02_FULL_64_12]|nr:MAG: hypothetical protein A3I00_04715 [Betaproteobacteria bacterium RIFCSPLOWO2_02_FULL_64_12]